MPTSFQNMATLTYTGGTVNSNIVTGELREVLTAAKTAVRENYEPGGTVTYVVSLTNSGITPLTGLTISDNLGGYTFTIQNTGNTPVTATDDVILRDTFDPVLNGLTVTYNGAPWTAGTQYTYDGTTGLFATTAGQITVPAATYTQDPVTGAWAVTPGVSELIVTGTV